ncbi:ribosomal L6 family protein [Neorickettsia helminthoeca str. Oregon]|uniref:50S ribosomal protein L6 n=1 Tax=Neorickettsia helminthoeca str. Oregon TaxID=1286528 RepID=X5HJG7_9RICK|nr:50S ribosomal protein L6 [Neorickettsia helminthoeca]AHX11224.1 ribosomal L6 family protein [Neorickettsia helminthoeca str. Oregon]
MSRVGQSVIDISGLKCTFDPSISTVSLSFGTATSEHVLPSGITCEIDGNCMRLKTEDTSASVLLGLHRSLLNNVASGLKSKFQRRLLLNGVGYKAEVRGRYLILWLGYTHNIKYFISSAVSITSLKPTELLIESSDKHILGLVVSDLCSLRKYDPYKGKGIFPSDVVMLRKESKKK